MDAQAMQGALVRYFAAEKQESLLFVAAGAVALLAAALLLRGGGPYRAMAWPLLAVGVIQLAVGGSVFLRTESQVATLEARLAADPAGFRAEEKRWPAWAGRPEAGRLSRPARGRAAPGPACASRASPAPLERAGLR